METTLLNEMIACLRGNRTVYRHYQDAHAVALLQRYMGKREHSVRQLKQSPVAKLLDKPLIKTVLKNAGKGVLTAEQLNYVEQAKSLAYILTVDQWSSRQEYRWDQTSRPGGNLVLQLNFSREHDNSFVKNTGIQANYFNGSYHPTCQRGRNTLAWARLDLDLDHGQALIEELQTDWLRDVQSMARRQHIAKSNGDKAFRFFGNELNTEKAEQYCHVTLKSHGNWQFTLLTAVLQFLWQEIGINDVYYHSFETGNAVKNIDCGKPPKSLYRDLPKAFCFEKDTTPPAMLADCKPARKRLKKVANPYWYRLHI